MDAFLRSWRSLLVAAIAGGCASPRGEPVGVSHHGESGKIQRPDGGPIARLSILPNDFRTAFLSVGRVPKSEHALGRYSAEVLASDAQTVSAMRAFSNVATDTLVVELHHDVKTNAPGPTYVMKKVATGWEFFAQDESGAVILDEHTNVGVRDRCARCHADAPHDGIFLPQ